VSFIVGHELAQLDVRVFSVLAAPKSDRARFTCSHADPLGDQLSVHTPKVGIWAAGIEAIDALEHRNPALSFHIFDVCTPPLQARPLSANITTRQVIAGTGSHCTFASPCWALSANALRSSFVCFLLRIRRFQCSWQGGKEERSSAKILEG
jgi:hypothetical protein